MNYSVRVGDRKERIGMDSQENSGSVNSATVHGAKQWEKRFMLPKKQGGTLGGKKEKKGKQVEGLISGLAG